MNPDKPRTLRTDAIDTYIRTRNDYIKTDHQVWREHCGILETELAAFKKNNEELIQRHNAAVSSWDEERERALREANRVIEYKEKYEDIEKYIRFIGKQIPCNTGGTYENDPIDAILDAAVRALKDKKPTRVDELNSILDEVITSWKEEKEHMKLSHDKTLESLRYNVERTKVFEQISKMFYDADYEYDRDAAKKIYNIVREHYPIGSYSPER